MPTASAKAMIEGLQNVAFGFYVQGNTASAKGSPFFIYEHAPSGGHSLSVKILFTGNDFGSSTYYLTHYHASSLSSTNADQYRRVGLFDICVEGNAGSITASDV